MSFKDLENRFLQTVDEHQGIIHKLCRMYRNNPEDQQDLFQEVVFHLWRGFPNFRNEAKVSTWIHSVAFNTAIANFRKKKIPMYLSEHIPEHLHPKETEEMSENEERLFEALRKLNDGEKVLISLYLEDYSYAEMAEIIGITENNIGVKLNRIKTKLKTLLT